MTPRIEYLIETLAKYRWLLIVPTVAGLIFALTYVIFIRSESWTSRQRLIIRDDLLGQPLRPGQFNSLEAMQSRQETILEIARSPEVIRNVMKSLGPDHKGFFFNPENFPDQATIESIQGNIRLSAPNGGEFGKSETVLLSVKESSANRSLELIELLVSEVEKNAEQVRRGILASMESELNQAKIESEAALQKSIQELKLMEQELGIDSLTMANISSTLPSDTTLRQEINQIETEKRALESLIDSLLTSQSVLDMASESPELLVSGTSSFLKEQFKLNQLAASIVQAQGTLAEQSGRYMPAHPGVRNAVETVEVIKRQLNSEIKSLQRALEPQIKEAQQRAQRLQHEIRQRQIRLKKLSDLRGNHIAINSEVSKRAETLNQLEANLITVSSYQQVGEGSVWFSKIGAPQISARPDGISNKAMVLAGGCLGFLFGCGVIMIVAPPMAPATNSYISNEQMSQSRAAEDMNLATAGTRCNNSSSTFGGSNQNRYPNSHVENTVEVAIPSHSGSENSTAGPFSEGQLTTENRHGVECVEVEIPNIQEKQKKQLERLEKLLGNKRQPNKAEVAWKSTTTPPVPEPLPIHASEPRQASEVHSVQTIQDDHELDKTASLLASLKEERAQATEPLKEIYTESKLENQTKNNLTGRMTDPESATMPARTAEKATKSLQTLTTRLGSEIESDGKSEVDRIRRAFKACQSSPFMRSID